MKSYSSFWKEHEKEIIIHKDKMNVVESCIDRHVESCPNHLAFVFDNGKRTKQYTYRQLQEQVNKFANYLNNLGVKEGSRVFLFLPKCPEMYISFLGVIKQGGIAIPLFEAFQKDGISLRLDKGDADFLITNEELCKRVPKTIKNKVPSLKHILIMNKENYDKIGRQSSEFNAVLKDKKDTALMIFTSSTAGTPVAGIEIPHQALIQQDFTARLVLDLKENTKYWCTAHPGWVTGAVYGIIAPLSVGCTTYVYEPHFDSKKWIRFLRKNEIEVLYTAPTVLRLWKQDIKKDDLKKLKNLCSVGEALTKTTYENYKKLGIKVNDTYWQTETGAIVIATWPGLKSKLGSIGKAIPGIKAEIKEDSISLKKSWPSMMTGIYKHSKMYSDYFRGKWFITNDNAKKRNGYFYFIGRGDDIIKTSGERVSPIEIESTLMKHKAVKEAAVIGISDKIKGSILKAFIVLNKNADASEKLKEELGMFVKASYAGHSYPKIIEFRDNLPKTNSGKIIRMKLREENR